MTGWRPKSAKLRRAALSIAKYANRLSTRPTPFGLFAGVSLGEFGSAHMDADAEASPFVQAQADFKWLLPLIQQLEQRSDVLVGLVVHTSELIRVKGSRLVLYRAGEGAASTDRIAIGRSTVLDRLIQRATGGIEVRELLDELESDLGTAPPQTLGLVKRLLSLDFLVSSLRPNLNGEDPLKEVIGGLPLDSPSKLGTELSAISEQIGSLTHESPAQLLPAYTRTTERMRAVQDAGSFINIQRHNGLSCTIPVAVQHDADQALALLQCMAPTRLGMRSLRAYHEAFLEKYGTDEIVPVRLLVSPTEGLGVPEDYKYPKYAHGTSASPPEELSDRRDGHLARLYASALSENRDEVVLTEEDVTELSFAEFDPEFAQQGAELYLTIASPSTTDLRAGNYSVVLGANPGSHAAGSTSGRFQSILGPRVFEQYPPPAEAETEYSAVLKYYPRSPAAMNLSNVHPAGERILTVNAPHLASLDSEMALRASDVGVGATLHGLYLKDLRTGQRINLRVHDTVYPNAQASNEARLLAETILESQRLWEPWSWGKLDLAPALPRVRFGRIVLSSRSWHLNDFRQRPPADVGEMAARLDTWRARWRVPTSCLAVSRDMRLLLNLENPGHVELLRHELRKDQSLRIEELPAGAETPADVWGWLARGSSPIASEIVVSFQSAERSTSSGTSTPSPYAQTLATERYMPLGDEWVSSRVYLPVEEMTPAIVDVVAPAVDSLSKRGLASTVHFVRYSDAFGPHLRVRFRSMESTIAAEAFSSLMADARRAGQISALELVEYRPETNRYGGPALLDLTHEAFAFDTRDALSALQSARSRTHPDIQDSAFASMVRMLTAFAAGFDGDDIRPEVRGQRWTRYLGFEASTNEEYQRHRSRWSEILSEAFVDLDPVGQDGTVSNVYYRLGARLADAERNGSSTSTSRRVIGSHLHMAVNRRFGTDRDEENHLLRIMRSVFDRAAQQSRPVGGRVER